MENRELPYERFEEIYKLQSESSLYQSIVCENEKDGTVLAFLNLRYEYQLHHAEKIAEILEFVVSPDCRGRGIGSEMLKEAFRLAEESGCTQIEVACNQLRRDTHRFYEKSGMKNYHFRFSRSFLKSDEGENQIGR